MANELEDEYHKTEVGKAELKINHKETIRKIREKKVIELKRAIHQKKNRLRKTISKLKKSKGIKSISSGYKAEVVRTKLIQQLINKKRVNIMATQSGILTNPTNVLGNTNKEPIKKQTMRWI